MRPAVFASFFAAFLASACGDSMQVEPVTVQWMDWPWQVAYGQPFRTRLVVSGVCARTPRFRPGATADQSAVTFAPYFVVGNENIACIAEVTSPPLLAYGGVDTAGMAPGLKESRVYEMRAASATPTLGAVESSLPNRTFGAVSVALPGDLIVVGRRNAAGFVSKEIDNAGCVRIRPGGLYRPGAGLVLENPVDTAGLSNTFVRGYIDQVVTPVCGETTVFHLVSRN